MWWEQNQGEIQFEPLDEPFVYIFLCEFLQ